MGMDISSASAEHDAQNLVLQQLQQQRNSTSGVSLDEEAANLIKFQRAYQAAAQIVSILDNLTAVAINLVGGTAVS
jgi:flagellar hook-associated protein 1 FlgK